MKATNAVTRDQLPPMTEDELLGQVLDAAHKLGWLVSHFRPARRANGSWATPVQGDSGFPDLVLARDGSVIVAELKGARGHLAPEQRAWLTALGYEPGVKALHRRFDVPGGRLIVALWRPEDWTSGEIERVLRWPPAREGAQIPSNEKGESS